MYVHQWLIVPDLDKGVGQIAVHFRSDVMLDSLTVIILPSCTNITESS